MSRAEPTTDRWRSQLTAGLQDMGVTLDDDQVERLLAYLALLQKWNRTYNLTAIRDPAQMVGRQLLDSLSIIGWIERGPVLDVGTGAGLPGIPLAIARPAIGFTLLDTNGKKTRFLRQLVGELGLPNVEVIQQRVERLQRPQDFAAITSRAFATLADMVAGSAHLLADDGAWLAMKGVVPTDEIAALPEGLDVRVEALRVPGGQAARHLVIIRPPPGSERAAL